MVQSAPFCPFDKPPIRRCRSSNDNVALYEVFSSAYTAVQRNIFLKNQATMHLQVHFLPFDPYFRVVREALILQRLARILKIRVIKIAVIPIASAMGI